MNNQPLIEQVGEIGELIQLASKQLANCSDSPLLDAKVLLADVLQKDLTYLLTWSDKQITEQQLAAFNQSLYRRLTGEPIAYIVGVKEFWSLPFFVAPSTLIPRPDTETLVELVLTNHVSKDLRLLDLGTGTGAIALSLASEQPSWQVSAVDFNEDAVALAQKNAKQLNLPQVNIYQSDWFSQVAEQQLEQQSGQAKFDVIVSNPPYIDEIDPHLAQGDVRFEPKSALVAKEQGLADIRHIAEHAKQYLVNGGAIYFEHGYNQGLAVRNILTEYGYSEARTEQDLAGNDRITWAVLTH